ncbi:MAG: xanthine dehydrogenase family protein subunit M [Actinomycetota bacterium]
MKPAAFKYVRAATVPEAASLLAEYGDEAKVLAGGQSLIPMMNMRLARPEVLVDIARIPGLNEIEANGVLTIGATTTQSAVIRSDVVRAFAPIIGVALGHVGHVGNRSRGTFGGTVAHADPASEMPAVLLALDAEIIATGPSGQRTISVEDFFVTTFETALADDEVLTSIRLLAPTGNACWSFNEVARRHGDYALVGVAATAELDGAGKVTKARIALSGVSDTPVRVKEAEESLIGKTLSDGAKVAGEIVSSSIDPPGDFHATKQYRIEVAGAIVTRALNEMADQKGTR